MQHLTQEDFKKKIFNYDEKTEWEFNGDNPIIIDFYADWCQPCKIVDPILEELNKEYKDKIDIFKVDVDKEHELSAVLGIKSIPSTLFIPKDKEPQMSVGALPKQVFIKAIDELFEIKE
jgi:thioredoxin 1